MILCIALVHIAVRIAAFYNINFECLLPTDVLVGFHGSFVGCFDHHELLVKCLHCSHSVL